MENTEVEVADEIITDVLNEIRVEQKQVAEAQGAWNTFINMSATREAAGEQIYNALFESAPSLQSLFTTPRAVQAMKFMVGIHDLVQCMSDAKGLLMLVETLGFQHLHLEVTPPRVLVFRDAILSLFDTEMGVRFTPEARSGLAKLLNYVGGALIFVRTHYAERLKLLEDSWAVANEKSGTGEGNHSGVDMDFLEISSQDSSEKKKNADGSGSKDEDEARKENISTQNLPTTFADMFIMNAAVMGLQNYDWMNDVISQFDNLVQNVANSNRLKEECDVLSLRLAKYDEKHIKLSEYKSCMLAALRSLLPKLWTTKHEVAWSWLWENVSRMLQANLGKPAKQRKAIEDYLEKLDDETAYEIRKNIYSRFFELAPAGQEHFKQSNTRLHFIAERIFQMVAEIYAEPERMVAEISALGLRHVGFGIPTDLFGPFVTSTCEVLAPMLEDPYVLESWRWSLGLISKILVRTINEGSTVVMKAINANSIKQLKRAISGAPRARRAWWLLLVKVGTQSISPLAWAIESGKMDMASAILTDLLTFRADREAYYYGINELFSRHPDIVKKICTEAPMVLPTLLEGLVWRSHRTKNNVRRVNYYIEHMLINKKQKGEFSEALKYIASLGDPSIMADPLVDLVSDTLWTGIVYRQFIQTKIWNIIGLAVFMLAQCVLNRLEAGNQETAINYTILICKTFTYIFGMGRLGFTQLVNSYIWSRKELKRIFEEIDQDGNGDIDWEEFKEGINTFKQLIKDNIKGALGQLQDDGKRVAVDENARGGAGQKKGGNLVNLLLFFTLVAMCTCEPMIACSEEPDFPTNKCEKAEERLYWYSVFTMCSMAVHWLVIIDLSVFSTELSAFLLVITQVLLEVKQFLIALTFLLLTFASAISILCRDCTDEGGMYGNIPDAVTSLFAITVKFYQGDFRDMSADPLLLTAVLICTTFSAVLLLNLLVAQINLSYEYIYRDMAGFARLNRASLICDAMDLCTRKKWDRFKANMKFDIKLEFDEGDVGIPGGVQLLESAAAHRTTTEQIQRFGGTTSQEAPWPEINTGEGEDRFDKLEQMLQRAIKQMTAGSKSRKTVSGGSSSNMGSSSMGTSLGADRSSSLGMGGPRNHASGSSSSGGSVLSEE